MSDTSIARAPGEGAASQTDPQTTSSQRPAFESGASSPAGTRSPADRDDGSPDGCSEDRSRDRLGDGARAASADDGGSGAGGAERFENSLVVRAVTGGRDARIDVFRGLALAMIYINHVPQTIYDEITSRNFGFSDAAELFVFLSGTSAGLAYSRYFRSGPLWPGLSRIWGRAWTLYLVHLFILVWVLALAAAVARWGGDPDMLWRDNMQYFGIDPTAFLMGLPSLTHQLGYVNILPLYIVLLLIAPLPIIAGLRAPWLTILGSGIVWAVCDQFRINLPNFPTPGGWFFNPLAWQFLFTIGLMTGIALKDGRRLVPRHPALIGLSGAIVLGALLWMKWKTLGYAANSGLRWLAQHGAPYWVRNFDKTFLAVPRLVHILAAAYFFSALPIVRRICGSPWLRFFDVLGRHALPVFAAGTLLSFAARAVRELTPPSLLLDTALIAAGLLALWLLAEIYDRVRMARAK
ncbi:OpgC family protein [Mesobaculum littorinae]|uniref:OpgC family protein n=1 Tax=Mesobaculum littorinae TaxID=2486419 RepID=UPI001F27C91C|nr:OpgC domain-containing protein [Mesobaculum littorinae]